MNKKGETFGCFVGIFGAVIFVIGVLICIFSRVWCFELDFTEDQRNACETDAKFMLVAGFLVTVVASFIMMLSTRLLGFFAENKGEKE